MVVNTNFNKPQAKQKTNHSISSFVFLSQDPEINASVSRYFKYVHKTIVTTITHPSQLFHSTSNQVAKVTACQALIISNEMLIDEDICSLYPFWFAFGLHKNIQVYAFTMQSTDYSCNLLNWADFLHLSWQKHFSPDIDFNKVSYFNNTRNHLSGILKPHGGDSLFDLAAGFHMTFANASQYIVRFKSSNNQLPAKFISELIDPGIAQFQEFQQKEPRHHSFLSMLPEGDRLFVAVQELGSSVDELIGINIQETSTLEALNCRLTLVQVQTTFIYSFFLNLEQFLSRDLQ